MIPEGEVQGVLCEIWYKIMFFQIQFFMVYVLTQVCSACFYCEERPVVFAIGAQENGKVEANWVDDWISISQVTILRIII